MPTDCLHRPSALSQRLFEPYCELQLLFEQELGEVLLRTFEAHRPAAGSARASRGPTAAPTAALAAAAGGDEDGAALDEAYARALPLTLLHRVCQRLLARPFADERALLRALRRAAPNAPPDAALFRISINRADAAGRLLLARGTCRRAAVAVLRGDALVSPHYRLGVGVNHAFETLPYVAYLLEALQDKAAEAAETAEGGPTGGGGALLEEAGARALLAQWEASSGVDAAHLSDYQLGVMYVEAHCGLLVMGGLVYRRVYSGPSEVEELPLSALDDVDCSANGTAEARRARLR